MMKSKEMTLEQIFLHLTEMTEDEVKKLFDNKKNDDEREEN
jgi:hypothetical protein